MICWSRNWSNFALLINTVQAPSFSQNTNTWKKKKRKTDSSSLSLYSVLILLPYVGIQSLHFGLSVYISHPLKKTSWTFYVFDCCSIMFFSDPLNISAQRRHERERQTGAGALKSRACGWSYYQAMTQCGSLPILMFSVLGLVLAFDNCLSCSYDIFGISKL